MGVKKGKRERREKEGRVYRQENKAKNQWENRKRPENMYVVPLPGDLKSWLDREAGSLLIGQLELLPWQ